MEGDYQVIEIKGEPHIIFNHEPSGYSLIVGLVDPRLGDFPVEIVYFIGPYSTVHELYELYVTGMDLEDHDGHQE